jgi:hypothetical protein
MPLFENIQTVNTHSGLTTDQEYYFKSVIINYFLSFNKNPLITFESLFIQLKLLPLYNVFKCNVKDKTLRVEFSYSMDNQVLRFDIQVSFDKKGDYLHYCFNETLETNVNINKLFSLFPFHRGDFNMRLDINTLKSSKKDNKNNCIVKCTNFFRHESLFNIHNFSIVYDLCNGDIIKKTIQFNEGYQLNTTPRLEFNIEDDGLFIDFLNALFLRESHFIDYYVHHTFKMPKEQQSRYDVNSLINIVDGHYDKMKHSPFYLVDCFKMVSDLFSALMEIEHKQTFLDELKVYDMCIY